MNESIHQSAVRRTAEIALTTRHPPCYQPHLHPATQPPSPHPYPSPSPPPGSFDEQWQRRKAERAGWKRRKARKAPPNPQPRPSHPPLAQSAQTQTQTQTEKQVALAD